MVVHLFLNNNKALDFLPINSIKNGGITHCIKLLGDKLSTRNFDSQINEINARIAVLNKFTELDRPHTHVFT